MSEPADFRAGLRAQLVAAAARSEPRRARRPAPRRAVVALGALAAVAAAVLAIVVLSRGSAPPPPATHRTLPGRPLFGGTLEPGVRYRSRSLGVPISFVVGRRWAADSTDAPDNLDLYRYAPGIQPRLDRAMDFVTFFRMPTVIDPASGAQRPAPADIAGWLARHPDLRAGTPRRTTLAGRAAIALDATVVRRPSREDPFCRTRFRRRCVALAPNVVPFAGTRIRFLVAPAARGPLLVAVGSSRPSRLGLVLRAARPTLDSLRIGR
jgi:hypothetical protein